ncbi:hypothetical protein [Streptomyces sp. NPDC059816]
MTSAPACAFVLRVDVESGPPCGQLAVLGQIDGDTAVSDRHWQPYPVG